MAIIVGIPHIFPTGSNYTIQSTLLGFTHNLYMKLLLKNSWTMVQETEFPMF